MELDGKEEKKRDKKRKGNGEHSFTSTCQFLGLFCTLKFCCQEEEGMGIDFIHGQKIWWWRREDPAWKLWSKGVKCICPVIYTNYSQCLDQVNVGSKREREREKRGKKRKERRKEGRQPPQFMMMAWTGFSLNYSCITWLWFQGNRHSFLSMHYFPLSLSFYLLPHSFILCSFTFNCTEIAREKRMEARDKKRREANREENSSSSRRNSSFALNMWVVYGESRKKKTLKILSSLKKRARGEKMHTSHEITSLIHFSFFENFFPTSISSPFQQNSSSLIISFYFSSSLFFLNYCTNEHLETQNLVLFILQYCVIIGLETMISRLSTNFCSLFLPFFME